MRYLTFVLLFCSSLVMAIEEPQYQVLDQSNNIELRAYEPMIIAETEVTGSLGQASSAGFRKIADYIFGNNTSLSGKQEKISMTAPVTMQPLSEAIRMTTPVTIAGAEGQWRMHFVMPSKYSMQSLPKPNNQEVVLRVIPQRYYAVLRFSGWAGEKKVARKTRELQEWMDTRSLKALGVSRLSRYNPPWTLPFMRRNEVMIPFELITVP